MSFPLDHTEVRDNFSFFLSTPIRWGDNDQYGHLNNARYYTLYENVIMQYLDYKNPPVGDTSGVQCFTAENGCRFLKPLSYPQVTETGLRVVHLGNSSVRYELGIFVEDDADVHATGFVVDIFVDAESQRPTRIPDNYRAILSQLQVS